MNTYERFATARRQWIQQTTSIGQPWENVGEPTAATGATNSITGAQRYFRVVGRVDLTCWQGPAL